MSQRVCVRELSGVVFVLHKRKLHTAKYRYNSKMMDKVFGTVKFIWAAVLQENMSPHMGMRWAHSLRRRHPMGSVRLVSQAVVHRSSTHTHPHHIDTYLFVIMVSSPDPKIVLRFIISLFGARLRFACVLIRWQQCTATAFYAVCNAVALEKLCLWVVRTIFIASLLMPLYSTYGGQRRWRRCRIHWTREPHKNSWFLYQAI